MRNRIKEEAILIRREELRRPISFGERGGELPSYEMGKEEGKGRLYTSVQNLAVSSKPFRSVK